MPTHGDEVGYEELDRELKNLNKGLECIQGLSLDEDQPAQALAVNEALNDCRLCMETFLQRIGNFSSLGTKAATAWPLPAFRENLRKVQWALLKKADIAKFRAEIQLHADALDMLLEAAIVTLIYYANGLQETTYPFRASYRRVPLSISMNTKIYPR
ncbi:hypothetical protein OEA41_003480 [Lepraria neglecta]|uniref:Fungal N-terminal domain-containing protein n=1 Tax=Lepraria neglecta TaxID=209136 RepID=A0AAD9Z5S5_9LECA|nr:hypothetical protein OEA41_003480 [Lepraria neglecta]